jgi:hypothetical protein
MSEALARDEHPREHYRDELNFAEFPLASVSTSLPKGQKTLEFTDEIFDKAKNERVLRKLTITASDKYGLPTAMDDEVILGLIQLTAKCDFAERRVYFTRYELLKLLGWSDDTRNYNRLEQSLKRWLGVTLYYDNAWWSKEEQCWASEGFHILDHVQILDKARQRRAATRGGEQTGKSSFVWNELVFNSFKSGYLKQIDFEFYKQLESSISKRMYRFLDKRFYHRARLEFDLRTFACEHIGLSKNYHNGELKRVLKPAIAELEAVGFLKTFSDEERFVRKSKGEWSAVFVREGKTAPLAAEDSALVGALVERGLNRNSARTLVAGREEGKVREKIALFDWLRARKDARVQRSPAGFLYRAISEDFAMPEDYLKATVTKAPARKVIPLRQPVRPEPPTQASDRQAINDYWTAIPNEERERIEEDLVANAPKFLRQQYVEGLKERGLLFQTVRQAMIDEYVRPRIKQMNENTKL